MSEDRDAHPATEAMRAAVEHALVQIGLLDNTDAMNLIEDEELVEIKIPWGTLWEFLKELASE